MFFKRLLSCTKVTSRNQVHVDLIPNKSGSLSLLPFEAIPGPKYYPLLGQFNDLIAIGRAEK